MRKPVLFASIAGVLVLALAVPAGAARIAGSGHGGRPLTAGLTGAAEVNPGDPDGSGSALVTVNPGHDEVCWELHVQDIALPALAAHIHVAPPGVNGPIVVHLSAPDAGGHATGCRTVDGDLADAIRKDPGAYYVNVHNSEFPGGAVRGQLSK